MGRFMHSQLKQQNGLNQRGIDCYNERVQAKKKNSMQKIINYE